MYGMDTLIPMFAVAVVSGIIGYVLGFNYLYNRALKKNDLEELSRFLESLKRDASVHTPSPPKRR